MKHFKNPAAYRPDPHRSLVLLLQEEQGEQRTLGVSYGDDQLLELVTNICAVLLTRGMPGTYIYVADPGLRENLRRRLSSV